MVTAPAALPWSHPNVQLGVDVLLTASLLLALVAHLRLQRPSRGGGIFAPRWWVVVLAVALLRGLAPNELWSGGVVVLSVAWLGWSSQRGAQAAEAERVRSASAMWPWTSLESESPVWYRVLQLSWGWALVLIAVDVLVHCRG